MSQESLYTLVTIGAVMLVVLSISAFFVVRILQDKKKEQDADLFI